MKIVLKASNLIAPLSMVSNVINPKHFVATLTKGLLVSKDGNLSIVGSDGEMEIEARIQDVALNEPLSVLVQVRKLLDYLKFLRSDDDVTLDFSADHLIVEASGDRFSINTNPGEDYPRLKFSDDIDIFKASLDRLALAQMIEKGMHAVANNDMRQYLNGMLFEFSGSNFCVVGTDGHRLAFSAVTVGQATDAPLQYIVPKHTAQEIAKLLREKQLKETEVRMECSKEGLVLFFDNHRLVGKLINAQYPAYDKVIPKPSDKHVVFEVEAFRNMIQKAAIVVSDASVTSAVRLLFTPTEVRADAENNVSETLSTSGIPIESNLKEEFNINFNSKYLLDSFAQIDTNRAGVYLNTSGSSVLIEEEDNTNRKFVLMPIKL